MAAGLARTAALAIRREFMMGAGVVEMQLLVDRSLLVNLKPKFCAWSLADEPPLNWLSVFYHQLVWMSR